MNIDIRKTAIEWIKVAIVLVAVGLAVHRAYDLPSLVGYIFAYLIFIPIAYFFYVLWQVIFALLHDLFYQIFPSPVVYHDVTVAGLELPEECQVEGVILEQHGFERMGDILLQSTPLSGSILHYFVSDKLPIVAILTVQNGVGLVQLVTTFQGSARIMTYYPDGISITVGKFEARIVHRSLAGALAFHQRQVERFRGQGQIPVFHKDIKSVLQAMSRASFDVVTATWDYRFHRNFRAAIFILLPLILVAPAWWALYAAPAITAHLMAQLLLSLFAGFLIFMYWRHLIRKDYVDRHNPSAW